MPGNDYEGIIAPTALYGAETWNVGAAEIECVGAQISEKYVWSNTNESSEK